MYSSNDMPLYSVEEYVGLDDNKYIGDLLADFKASKDRSKGEILHCKLILKKKLFRESDEAVTDPMFVQLSFVQVCVRLRFCFTANLLHLLLAIFEFSNYFSVRSSCLIVSSLLQLQHDYVLGNYPVGRDDAAQLSALQILVEIGFVGSPETCTLVAQLCFSFFSFFFCQSIVSPFLN